MRTLFYCWSGVYIAPSAWSRPLMALMAIKWLPKNSLESHDEQLMLIIPVVGRYNTQ
ncbi:hypothetical protein A2U01_0062316, partial [Trifolium medium]|nr:hypothetical protein [Trifolium medium]